MTKTLDQEKPVAIVTGSAQGIGKAIADRLLHDGFRVVIADLSKSEHIAAQLGNDAYGVDVDVSDPEQVRNMIAVAINKFGRLDALVNNAGIYTSIEKKPFQEIQLEEWRRVFEVNVEGVWHCCRYAAEPMKKAGIGAIVNISSASVIKGNPLLLHYVASKGAVQAMTRVLARELGEFGIRVNTVSPGFTVSEGILSQGDSREAQRTSAREARLLQQELQPEDIASAVAYLLRPEAKMITGQNLTVDGGMVMN